MKPEEAIWLIRNLPTMCEFTDAYGEPIDSDDYYDAVDMAISALEKQIPKKPEDLQLVKNAAGYTFSRSGKCPCCGETVEYYCNSWVCDLCGQAIDWGNNYYD